jgi:hypothetical protein
MAVVPVEVIQHGNVAADDVTVAVGLANSVQKEFLFLQLPDNRATGQPISLPITDVQPLALSDIIESFRRTLRGYHPFLLILVDDYIDESDFYRSFLAEKGIAVVTINDVPDRIVPRDRMAAYFLYYLARSALSFIVPHHQNHIHSQSCAFEAPYRARFHVSPAMHSAQ